MLKERTVAEQVRAIVDATEIHSEHAFSFAGKMISADAAVAPSAPAVSQSPASIVPSLAQTLYERCYCTRFPARSHGNGSIANGKRNDVGDGGTNHPDVSPIWNPANWNAEEVAAFQRGLSEANTGADMWDEAWHVRTVLPGGQVVAAKGDWLRMFQPGEYLTRGATGGGPQVNAALRILAPRESWVAQPGFYYAFGSAVTDALDDLNIVRLYWNVTAHGSARLLRELTSALNRYAIPFKYKCQIYPQAYERIDGTVLFIARRYFRVAMESLREVYANVARDLHADVPLFTHELRPGLSVAEDPGTGESFGMHRMRFVAEGLWTAFANGVHDADARFQHVVTACSAAGISFSAPHLNAGAAGSFLEEYQFPE